MFQTAYQEFIYTRTYSRWLEDELRRERWPETVERYREFFRKRIPEFLWPVLDESMEAVRRLDVMPSMRALQTAGPALERENVAGYNCSYLVIDSPKAMADMLYILMNGTGVGFSTERQYIENLPVVPEFSLTEKTVTQENTLYLMDEDFTKVRKGSGPPIVVRDSKRGWAEAFLELLTDLYNGRIRSYDLSQIRPAGSRLKTFGGRASGPKPLDELFQFTIRTFINASGRKLTSIEVYDICVKIAECVVVGGVRRSATINLSDQDDEAMRFAKVGEFWVQNPQRSLSNNSAVYNSKPTWEEFMVDWTALVKSGTGERGIVNREGLKAKVASLPNRDPNHEFGVNPCGEIILRPKQFCNLTEVVVRPDDTLSSLELKVIYATFLGAIQSTLTDFKFLDEEWKKNTEDERLLGVSLTGLKDHPVLGRNSELTADALRHLRYVSRLTADLIAIALDIPSPTAVTCVKPSGTVSQLVSASSGIHSRYSEYYIRRVRVDVKDPLAAYLMDAGVPWFPEVGQTEENMTVVVFEFPEKSPEGSVLKGQESAIEQLEYWKLIAENWADHNPSNTIYVKPHEWDEVGKWVYDNWDIVAGLSFLPDDGGVYQLAPYEAISKEEYERRVSEMPQLDFRDLSLYEKEDMTTGSREFACVGDKCEI